MTNAITFRSQRVYFSAHIRVLELLILTLRYILAVMNSFGLRVWTPGSGIVSDHLASSVPSPPHRPRPAKLQLTSRLCCCHISCFLFCATWQHAAPLPRLRGIKDSRRTQPFPFPVTTTHQTNLCVVCAYTSGLLIGKVIAYSKLVSASRVRI